MKKYLEIGKIQNTHGIAGDMTVYCLCDSPDVFVGIDKVFLKEKNEYREYKMNKKSVFKPNVLLVHLVGIDSREFAATFKEKFIFADRADLPALNAGSYYIADLLGLSVIDAKSGRIYGKITDVINNGASDIYEITSSDNREFLFPAVGEFIDRVDLNEGVYVNPIEGMF